MRLTPWIETPPGRRGATGPLPLAPPLAVGGCAGGTQPGANHGTKSGGQGAQSCWEQIRLDYPAFTYSGINSTTSPLPPVAVEYNDAP